jgi:hypothetical protein
MRFKLNTALALIWLLSVLCFCINASTARAQVDPAEITNPQLKTAETTYYSKIMALYHALNAIKTPFQLQLSRYVGVDPTRESDSDARGVEFVYFQSRLLLKISGNYAAAYSAERLTQNQRASRVFSEVIAPALSLVTREIPEDVACDGIGFEIAYHVRTNTRNFDYEGREILVVVLDRSDAFSFAHAGSDAGRQEILNRSRIYLDGSEFGLALGQDTPFDLEAIGRTVTPRTDPAPVAVDTAADSRGTSPVNPKLVPPRAESGIKPTNTPSGVTAVLPGQQSAESHPAATAADIERLQTQFQSQLDALASVGQTKFHLVSYAPPSFVLYRNQALLQLTLRNPFHFPENSGSIYKRAAQSFDLFLAIQLKNILDAIPGDASFDGYDITVLDQLGPDPRASSEAIEFICPRTALRQFVDADVTNQQLIDGSIVLVNGVRIALNLQLVE